MPPGRGNARSVLGSRRPRENDRRGPWRGGVCCGHCGGEHPWRRKYRPTIGFLRRETPLPGAVRKPAKHPGCGTGLQSGVRSGVSSSVLRMIEGNLHPCKCSQAGNAWADYHQTSIDFTGASFMPYLRVGPWVFPARSFVAVSFCSIRCAAAVISFRSFKILR